MINIIKKEMIKKIDATTNGRIDTQEEAFNHLIFWSWNADRHTTAKNASDAFNIKMKGFNQIERLQIQIIRTFWRVSLEGFKTYEMMLDSLKNRGWNVVHGYINQKGVYISSTWLKNVWQYIQEESNKINQW